MRKIAFVGSRDWPDPQRVALAVNACFNEHGKFILVSGGAEGASHAAEATAQEFGIPVISFRPVKLDDLNYAVDEWRMHRGRAEIVRDPITWSDWQSAANFRSMLIAQRADEGFVFWDGFSRGTSYEIECFDNEQVPFTLTNLRFEKERAA